MTERHHYLQIIFDDILTNPKFQSIIRMIKYIHEQFFLSLPGISLWWNGLVGV